MDQTEKKTVLEGGSEATRTGVDNHEWALQSLTRERDALRWLLALTEKTVMLLRQDIEDQEARHLEQVIRLQRELAEQRPTHDEETQGLTDAEVEALVASQGESVSDDESEVVTPSSGDVFTDLGRDEPSLKAAEYARWLVDVQPNVANALATLYAYAVDGANDAAGLETIGMAHTDLLLILKRAGFFRHAVRFEI